MIVDDGSTDASLDISKEYMHKDQRVHVYHKQNGGASSARNYALDRTKGDYIVFCDSDDIPGKYWLQSFADNVERDIDMIVSGFVYRNEECDTVYQVSADCMRLSNLAEKLSLDNTFGYIWNKCFRAKVINDNHIRFDERTKFLEDEEFVGNFWKHIKKISISTSIEYIYNVPDFGSKYGIVDNYRIYVKMLNNAMCYIPNVGKSEVLRKYTMGCFRCMLIPFQNHRYKEGWNRLKDFVSYGAYFKSHNRYMRLITQNNYMLWFPVLVIYTAINKR